MVVGSYLITSIHMRISDGIGSSKYIGPNDSPVLHGPLTPIAVRERCERVFKMVPKKMKNLVLVNSALSTFDFIQACVKVADKYSDNVMVIPPLLALATFALEEIAKFRNPPDKEIVLVVTITPGFVDFVILRRDSNFILYIAEFEHFEVKLNEYKEKFAEFYNFSYPHSTILLVHETVHNIAEEIRYEFQPENCFISSFKQWHYILLYGGMLRAMDEEDGFDTRYHIANFSNGYETTIQNHRTRTLERHILLPPRSSLPCNISLQQTIPPMLINVFYSPEYYQLGNELIPTKKAVTKQAVYSSGTLNEIIGYIDERGIPFVKDSAAFMNRQLHKNTKADEQTPRKQNSNETNQVSRASETTVSSQSLSSSVNDSPQIKFIFHKNLCAIEVVQNGASKFLTDSFDNKWTPLYLSMAESTVQIGEKAKSHFFTFPKHVIYDVLEVIGKPLNEIKINPKWGFELIEKHGIVYFQIETLSGPRLFPQEIVFAAFLKSMKIQTESNLNVEINEIHLSTHLQLNESQKNVIIKAAAKNNIEILSFDIL